MGLIGVSHVPRAAPPELRRERLLGALRSNSLAWLIVLCAPTRFGKTTLAAAYPRESGAAVGWLTLLAALAEQCAFLIAREDSSYRLHPPVRGSLLTKVRVQSPVRANRAWAVAQAVALETADMAADVRACNERGSARSHQSPLDALSGQRGPSPTDATRRRASLRCMSSGRRWHAGLDGRRED